METFGEENGKGFEDYFEESEVTTTQISLTELASIKTSSSEDQTEGSVSLGPVQKGNVSPFQLTWAFGVNTSVDVLNLTNKTRSVVFYACSHAGVLFDYVASSMRMLQGHKNVISSISADDTGRWLVTADKGDDSTIIIWDSFECIPVNTIFEPHPGCGTAITAISGNAKYLVSIGNESKPSINFWLWTFGQDQPNDCYIMKTYYGLPQRICFNPTVQEHIWVAFQKQVLFFVWDPNANKLLPPVTPAIRHFRNHGLITDCTYFEKCHQCIASTNKGVILIFGSSYYTKGHDEGKLQNDKLFVKAIKISRDAITCVKSVDGLLATGDAIGHIKFYDNTTKIIFWCQNFTLPTIKSISFNLDERRYKLTDALDFTNFNVLDSDREIPYEDKSESFEYLYTNLVPKDATVNNLPFIVRDFVIATADGRIASIDYMQNRCNYFHRVFDGPVTAIETHDECPYLCVGFANSNICLYNYESKVLLVEVALYLDSSDAVPITEIKYSPQGLHLACGKKNGHLWFVDPVGLTPKTKHPIDSIKNKIMKIVFSIDSTYCAYYNDRSTIVILRYISDDDVWEILGKMKSHYKPIHDILFTPYLPPRLFTIGADRILNEYDLKISKQSELVIRTSERIEQCAIPVSFIYYPPNEQGEQMYFYMCDNQFKYKVMHDTTFMCHRVVLGPAYGCYEKSAVHDIAILPKRDNKYMVYANDNYIGIQMFPPDGNPHKYIGIIGHPIQLLKFRVSQDGNHVFTIGKNDNCILMWQTDVSAVETTYVDGGAELEPYYCLIEGGLHGWLFKEMQDLFYYIQILHQGEDTVLPRTVSDCIPVAELPDLMRACGFYPTEYEIENMIVDLKYREFDETKTLKDDVSFLEFIQLYVNFRPAHGISMESLKEKFEAFTVADPGPHPGTITRQSFVTTICQRGEPFSRSKAHTCLATLMHEESQDICASAEQDFSYLPPVSKVKLEAETIRSFDNPKSSVGTRISPKVPVTKLTGIVQEREYFLKTSKALYS